MTGWSITASMRELSIHGPYLSVEKREVLGEYCRRNREEVEEEGKSLEEITNRLGSSGIPKMATCVMESGDEGAALVLIGFGSKDRDDFLQGNGGVLSISAGGVHMIEEQNAPDH